jgi:hypothetical protein
MRRIFYENGLSIVLFALFALTLFGQTLTGLSEYNEDQQQHGRPAVGYVEYLATGHFVEATFENWESEFLQMAAFVLLTAFLYQKGSAESRAPGSVAEEDVRLRHEDVPADAPWPVRRGGWALKFYENSLAIAFALLFLLSVFLHALGGAEEYNQEHFAHGGAGQRLTFLGYMATARFWFESFQNWQSEFLSVFAMVVLSIFLRQRSSPESKPVHAPHSETGR